LQALSNVDASRTNLNAQVTVHTVAQPLCFDGLQVRIFRAMATTLASLLVVGDDQGVLVKHGALKPGVRAHVFADLLAHEACIPISCKAVKNNPKQGPAKDLSMNDCVSQSARWHEIGYKAETRDKRDCNPDAVLDELLEHVLRAKARLIQFHALRPVAFDQALDVHEDFRVDGLWARKSAPHPPCDGGDQEQGEGAADQQARQVDEVLGVENEGENEKAPILQIEKHAGSRSPLKPR
jgi:hypothetical protein